MNNATQTVSAARWRTIGRVALLVAVVTLIWCAHYDRWTAASWSVPLEYRGDAPEIFAQMRAAADGDIWPFTSKVVERLGAPFGAYWNGYPTPDKPLLLLVGALTRVIGLFAAANVVMLLAAISSALSFYFAARWLRCRWEWAWVGALLYAFTYHTFHRGLGHFSLAFTWTVPLGLLAVWLVAKSRQLQWRSRGAVVCLVAAVALGVSNPYNLLFWLQLMGWAVLGQWFAERRRANLMIGAAAIGLAILTFFLSHIEVWAYTQEPDGAPLVVRNYAGTEVYALKPIEMLTPPRYHRWGGFAFLGQRYERWSPWRGEAYLPYVGLVGIAGLIGLGLLTAKAIFHRRALPGQAISVGWLMAYASIGGVTNVLALLAGFQIFRATNRVAVFISAILLIFVVVRVSRLTMRWPRWGSWGTALVVAVIGVLDQVPRADTAEVRQEIAANALSDLQLGRELEAALPARAMVFQLPVLGFPEVLPPNRLTDYELFRPFLVTRTLRFSYGAAKSRARSRWQRDLENVPAATLVRRLESYGFAALYLNRKGFKDEAEGLLTELSQLGYNRRIVSPRGQQVVVLLNPDPHPVPPLGRALTYGQGWFNRPFDGVRWANDDAVLSYFNPYGRPLPITIELTVEAVTERDVWFEYDNKEVARTRVGSRPTTLRIADLPLQPGVGVFMLRSSQPAVRLGSGQYQLRTFGVHRAVVKTSTAGPPTE